MFTTISSVKFFYQDKGEGTPILFIHGFPLNHQMWRPQIDELSSLARVIAPDLRGYGDSQSTPGAYTMESLADDCANLLDAIGITSPVIVAGLSMGGYISLAFYRKYRERVASLVLASTRAGADSDQARESRDRMAELANRAGPGAIAEAMLPKLMAPQNYHRRPGLVRDLKSIMESSSTDGVVGALQGMKTRPDSTPLLPQIQVPTLVIHGEDDQIIPPAEAALMADSIPGSRLHIVPDAGHMPTLEQPETFNQLLSALVANI